MKDAKLESTKGLPAQAALPKKGSAIEIKEPTPAAEEVVEVKEEATKFQANDYMEKAQKQVPQDPEGNETLHKDLVITAEKIKEILEQTMLKTLTWLLAEK
jgi:hypothetical protein